MPAGRAEAFQGPGTFAQIIHKEYNRIYNFDQILYMIEDA